MIEILFITAAVLILVFWYFVNRKMESALRLQREVSVESEKTIKHLRSKYAGTDVGDLIELIDGNQFLTTSEKLIRINSSMEAWRELQLNSKPTTNVVHST